MNVKHIHPLQTGEDKNTQETQATQEQSKEPSGKGLDDATWCASGFSVACKDLAKHLEGLREAYNSGGDVLKSYLREYHRLNQICKDEYAVTHGD